MSLKLHCLAFFVVVSAHAQTPVWSQLPASPGPETVRHDDIYFTDPTNGWASQDNDIYRTTNGGATWTTNLVLAGTHFRAVTFANPSVGFAGNLGVGSYDGAVSNTNVMYCSYDGGVTWTNVDGFGEAGMMGLCSMYALDPQHIYGAGRVRGPAFFIKSSNGGTNWTIVNLTALGVMNGIMDVYFKDTNNGWVVGMDPHSYSSPPYYGRIAMTTDGGNTWTPQVTTTIPDCYFWKMSWPATNVAYCALQQNGSYSNIVYYKSIDGGMTWVSNAIPETSVGLYTNGYNFYLQGIGFVSTNEGWIGGASGLPSYGPSFLHTTNGGATWAQAGFNDTFFLNRIRFLSPTLGFASGGNLYTYSVPLTITNQPQSQQVVGPTNVQLSVSAVGSPPLAYQWLLNGSNIVGAASPVLNLMDVLRTNSGTYSVVISNGFTTVVSSNATLRVLVPERLAQPIVLPGKNLQIQFNDADGGAILTTNDLVTFSVYASSNLSTWFSVTNALTLTNGSIYMQASLSNSPELFYKIVEQ